MSDDVDALEQTRDALHDAMRECAALRRERDALRRLIPMECCEGGNPNCHGPRGCLLRALENQPTYEALQRERDVLRAGLTNLSYGAHCGSVLPEWVSEIFIQADKAREGR